MTQKPTQCVTLMIHVTDEEAARCDGRGFMILPGEEFELVQLTNDFNYLQHALAELVAHNPELKPLTDCTDRMLALLERALFLPATKKDRVQ